ncbi:hypothetical protein [Lacisediminimonas sp.]
MRFFHASRKLGIVRNQAGAAQAQLGVFTAQGVGQFGKLVDFIG